MCDAHLGAHGEARDLDVVIEPADTLRYAASGAKRVGILRVPERALHIELPKAARTEWREVYTAVPAGFLLQAAAADPGREPPCRGSSRRRGCGASASAPTPGSASPAPTPWGTPG